MRLLVNLFLVLYLESAMAQLQVRQTGPATSYSQMYFTSGNDPKLTKTATKVHHPTMNSNSGSSGNSGSLRQLYQDRDEQEQLQQLQQLQSLHNHHSQQHEYEEDHQQQQQHQYQQYLYPPNYQHQLENGQHDMQPEESTSRLQVTPKYSTTKQKSYKQLFESDEDVSDDHYKSLEDYSDESPNVYQYKYKENHGNHGYSMGTKLQVQQPKIPASRNRFTDKGARTKINHFSTQFDDFSHELPEVDVSYVLPPASKKHKFESSRMIGQTKPVHFTAATSSQDNGYDVFEPDTDFLTSDDIKANLRQQFKEVASQKQIEQYLEDQEKFLNEAFKWQILHNPKYKKFAKGLKKEPLYEAVAHNNREFESYKRSPHRKNFPKKSAPAPYTNRSRRRPSSPFAKGDLFKHATKPKNGPSLANNSNRRYRQAIVIEV